MLLKPIQIETKDPIAEALEIAGIPQTSAPLQAASKNDPIADRVRSALNISGASIEEASMALASAMQNEDTRLQAAKLAFELHGALNDKNKQATPSISIVITGSSETANKSLLTILAPREITLDGTAA